MSVRYHINPDTGNVNKCTATQRCRFGSDESHFSDKADALRAVERSFEAKALDARVTLEGLHRKLDTFERRGDYNPLQQALGELHALEDSEWSDINKENLLALADMEKLLSGGPTEPELTRARDLLGQMKYDGGRDYKRSDALASLSQTLFWRRQADAKPATPAPTYEPNGRLYGASKSAKEILDHFTAYSSIHLSSQELNDAIGRMVAGESYESEIPAQKRTYFTVSKNDLAMFAIHKSQAVRLATVFPQRELKEELERVGVEGVEVNSFFNSREYGNVYTVADPSGVRRSFSVYEHRNSDSIIINGATDWHPQEDELPYAADSSHQYFAEISSGDDKQAARTLAYFLKRAQAGELESDAELVRKAPKLDWNAILSEHIPGYGKWAESRGVKQGAPTDDEILKRLDF